MKKLFNDTGLRWLWLTILLLIIDQVSKQWVANTFDYRETLAVFPHFNLTYVHNPGAAFSFLADQGGWQRWFFTAIASIASILFIVWMAKTPKKQLLLCVAFAFILSGAVGNLIDRVLFGYVIDFLDFYWGDYHFAAFNIADSAIFIGAALMILDSFKTPDAGKKEHDKSSEVINVNGSPETNTQASIEQNTEKNAENSTETSKVESK